MESRKPTKRWLWIGLGVVLLLVGVMLAWARADRQGAREPFVGVYRLEPPEGVSVPPSLLALALDGSYELRFGEDGPREIGTWDVVGARLNMIPSERTDDEPLGVQPFLIDGQELVGPTYAAIEDRVRWIPMSP